MTNPSSSQEAFGVWIGIIARLWRNEVDRRLAAFGVTESRWLTLLHLSRMDDPVTQRELADAMGVQAPTLVHILDWLETEGLVERRIASTDRRSKSVHLSDKAKPILERIEATTAQVRADIFAGIPDADVRTCLSVFERLAGRLGGPVRPLRRADKQRTVA